MVKIKIRLIIVFLLVSICTYGQKQKDLGVGTFTLQWFHYPNAIFSTDSTNNILLKRIYYIKHSRVIMRTIGPPEKIQKNNGEVTLQDKGIEVQSKITASVVYPTYLADYKNNDYFMFFEQTKKSFYYKDSLKNHPEDIYNPKISNKDSTRIINLEGGKINIAGKHCLTALAVTGNDTTKFYYTEEKLKFVSPLNMIRGVTKPILGIQIKQKDGNAFGIFITNIKDEELPDDFFIIPPTSQLKTWSEVMSSRNISN